MKCPESAVTLTVVIPLLWFPTVEFLKAETPVDGGVVARCTTGPRRAVNNASRNHFTRSARCTTGPRRAVKD